MYTQHDLKSHHLGTIHILHKQRGWVDGVSKMLTFAYMVVGWVKANAYVSIKLTIEGEDDQYLYI